MAKTNFEQRVFLFAGVIIPELENNGALEQLFLTNFEKLMQGIEPESYDKIKLLIKVIAVLSWTYNLKSFEALSSEQKDQFIDRLFHFPISKVVAGLTGLKSLVFIAYYGIPIVWKEINYNGPIVKNANLNA
jgi:hypothetical protein